MLHLRMMAFGTFLGGVTGERIPDHGLMTGKTDSY